MKVDMDMERRARHRDKTDVFAEESEALDQIAKQVNIYIESVTSVLLIFLSISNIAFEVIYWL